MKKLIDQECHSTHYRMITELIWKAALCLGRSLTTKKESEGNTVHMKFKIMNQDQGLAVSPMWNTRAHVTSL